MHADTDDARGIDVAFLYDDTLFDVPRRRGVGVLPCGDAPQRHPRDRPGQLPDHHARGPDLGGVRQPLALPQRRPVRVRRATAPSPGRPSAYFHERVLEVHGPDTPVLAMGDFNDEPFDPSLVPHALSTRQQPRYLGAGEPAAVEPDVARRGHPDGSFYFDNQPNLLDQFLVNKNMATGDARSRPTRPRADPQAPAMVDTGVYPKPIPFGGMGNPVNQDGFSDHFPITMTVTEKD